MNNIIRFYNSVKTKTNLNISDKFKTLGRWQITYNKSDMNKKIDLANEDNCGVCYSTKYHNIKYIEKLNNKDIKKSNLIIDIE